MITGYTAMIFIRRREVWGSVWNTKSGKHQIRGKIRKAGNMLQEISLQKTSFLITSSLTDAEIFARFISLPICFSMFSMSSESAVTLSWRALVDSFHSERSWGSFRMYFWSIRIWDVRSAITFCFSWNAGLSQPWPPRQPSWFCHLQLSGWVVSTMLRPWSLPLSFRMLTKSACSASCDVSSFGISSLSNCRSSSAPLQSSKAISRPAFVNFYVSVKAWDSEINFSNLFFATDLKARAYAFHNLDHEDLGA